MTGGDPSICTAICVVCVLVAFHGEEGVWKVYSLVRK